MPATASALVPAANAAGFPYREDAESRGATWRSFTLQRCQLDSLLNTLWYLSIAGDTKWYFWPNGFVREFFGILAMERNVHLRAVAVIAAVCAVDGCVEFLGFIA